MFLIKYKNTFFLLKKHYKNKNQTILKNIFIIDKKNFLKFCLIILNCLKKYIVYLKLTSLAELVQRLPSKQMFIGSIPIRCFKNKL